MVRRSSWRSQAPLGRGECALTKTFTQAKMKRRLERIDESVARYLSQLETADRQAAGGADVPAAKVARLKEKVARLNTIDVQL